MKLRGRFTLTLAVAALVPISVAAVVTRTFIADSYRGEYAQTRRSVEKQMEQEVRRLQGRVSDSVDAITNDPFVGTLLKELVKGRLGIEDLKTWRQQASPVMVGRGLDTFTVTGPDNRVIISPHLSEATGETQPDVRKHASSKNTYFVIGEFTPPIDQKDKPRPVLVVETARVARDQLYSVAIAGGRKVTGELFQLVRERERVDARIVGPDGTVFLAPHREADWPSLTADPPIQIALLGPDGKKVATVEVAVGDNDLGGVLAKLTYISAGLALAALGAVVLLGLLVARRTARDLESLVEGSLAASRGDLEHRVPVRSKDEIGAVASAFNFMMEDLHTSKERLVIAERIAAWQEIARRLAHEIKNPLTPIQMAMDNLRKTWKKQHPSFGEILEESTTTVLQEADRLKHIVTEFSDFARMPKPSFARVDLNEVIRSAMALYAGTARIDVRLGDKLPQIDADKAQVNQVVLNLVENARDAIGQRDGGKITVATRYGDTPDRLMLVVEDNGPGVPSELKDKVFAPYFSTKLSKGGTGLGLAIVHRIVSDHGGRITLSDAPGGGARFAIEIPLRNGSALLASRI